MDRNTVLAIILAAIVLFGWQYYAGKTYLQGEMGEETGRLPGSEGEAQQVGPGPVEHALGTEAAGAEKHIVATQIEEKETVIETDKFIATLSNIGGCIKSIRLKGFINIGTEEPLLLAQIPGARLRDGVLLPPAYEEGIFNLTNLSGRDISHMGFDRERKGGMVEYKARINRSLAITKRYIFNNTSDTIELEIFISNDSSADANVYYSIVAASNIAMDSAIDKRYTQIIGLVGDDLVRDRGRKNGGREHPGNGQSAIVHWAGLQNKYFSIIAKPSPSTIGMTAKLTDNNSLLAIIRAAQFSVPAGRSVSHNYILYAAPTDPVALSAYGMEKAADYGAFWGISKVLVAGLRLFNRIFRNWGVAIILLAALANLALLPLTRHSYASMKKMQDVQPHMEKLRTEHKNNPQKLNKEMMELYKKHNVNPMGGCLPMFLQIPVFWALYKALLRSLELRGAGFLWMKDLSGPDAVPLPITLPVIGNSINILPLMMMAAMVVQQRSSMMRSQAQSEQQRQQQQMMMFMPLLFGFILYNFPSGLVLYWLTNTVLTIIEQKAILKK